MYVQIYFNIHNLLESIRSILISSRPYSNKLWRRYIPLVLKYKLYVVNPCNGEFAIVDACHHIYGDHSGREKERGSDLERTLIPNYQKYKLASFNVGNLYIH